MQTTFPPLLIKHSAERPNARAMRERIWNLASAQRAVCDLLRGERGEATKCSIELRGERIKNLSPSDLVKRGVIQVMEGRHCFAHLTIEENLLTGA